DLIVLLAPQHALALGLFLPRRLMFAATGALVLRLFLHGGFSHATLHPLPVFLIRALHALGLISHRPPFGAKPPGFGRRRHFGDLDVLHAPSRRPLDVGHRNPSVHGPPVHHRDVGDVGRPVDDRRVVVNHV